MEVCKLLSDYYPNIAVKDRAFDFYIYILIIERGYSLLA